MKELQDYPAAERSKLNVGYMRLTDAAPFIIAKERGIFAACGLDVTLHQEISWANLRDKLASGDLDAAQMLAPLPAMCTLGVSGLRVHMLTGLVLSHNGNAITLNTSLWYEIQSLFEAGKVVSIPQALRYLALRRDTPMAFATVHAFSTHTLLLRRWLQSAGLHPDRDVRTVVVPPSQMVDSLEMGLVDGFCVGEPWNTIAKQSGVGETIALGQDIWPDAPEKVLAVRADVHDAAPHAHHRLRVALLQACSWLDVADHRRQAVPILAREEFLDLPQPALLPALANGLAASGRGFDSRVQPLHTFYGEHINRPNFDVAYSMVRECTEMLGKPLSRDVISSVVDSTWRTDLYEQSRARLDEIPLS
ncbi:MAG: CmpA/NrtA family ABC transporter substrate-binding protein [Pseudomonadota bacterium]